MLFHIIHILILTVDPNPNPKLKKKTTTTNKQNPFLCTILSVEQVRLVSGEVKERGGTLSV